MKEIYFNGKKLGEFKSMKTTEPENMFRTEKEFNKFMDKPRGFFEGFFFDGVRATERYFHTDPWIIKVIIDIADVTVCNKMRCIALEETRDAELKELVVTDENEEYIFYKCTPISIKDQKPSQIVFQSIKLGIF